MEALEKCYVYVGLPFFFFFKFIFSGFTNISFTRRSFGYCYFNNLLKIHLVRNLFRVTYDLDQHVKCKGGRKEKNAERYKLEVGRESRGSGGPRNGISPCALTL